MEMFNKEKFYNIKNPKELMDFMNQNIAYGFIGKNRKKYYDANANDWIEQYCIQSGEEVIKSKIGTCYDQVELERLWFENNNYKFKTLFAWFKVDRENKLPTHTFLIYQYNNKWYWFEHAWYDLKGIYEFNSEHELINYFKKEYYNYVKSNYEDFLESDKEKFKFYEYEKPNEKLGVLDYIYYVTNIKKEIL
jgi:hypothetical protein